MIASQLMRYHQDLQEHLAIVAGMAAFSFVVPPMFSNSKGAAATLSPIVTNLAILNGHTVTVEG